MRACASVDDCAEGFDCICGACSLACEADVDCVRAELLGTCVGAESAGFGRQCEMRTPEAEALCLAPCDRDADCETLGEELICEDRVCVRSAVPVQPTPSPSARTLMVQAVGHCSGDALPDGLRTCTLTSTGPSGDVDTARWSATDLAGGVPAPPTPGAMLELACFGVDDPGPDAELLARGASRVPPAEAWPGDAMTLSVRLLRRGELSDVCNRLAEPRAGHSATRLLDGRVLLAGGAELDADGEIVRVLQSAEIYDPQTGLLSPVEQDMQQSRAHHAATLLPDGRVLVTGGFSNLAGELSALVTAEIFDPADGRFTFVGGSAMRAMGGRAHHRAVLVPGRPEGAAQVFISGGVGTVGRNNSYHASTEIFSVADEQFSEGPTMDVARAHHTATALERTAAVLITGGRDGSRVHSSIEILDAATGQLGVPSEFSQVASDFMGSPRSQHSAVRLERPSSEGEAVEYVVLGGGFLNTNAIGTTGIPRAHFAQSVELFSLQSLQIVSDTAIGEPFASGCATVSGTGTQSRVIVSGGLVPADANRAGAINAWLLVGLANSPLVATERLDVTQAVPRSWHACAAVGAGAQLMSGGFTTERDVPTVGTVEEFVP